MKQNLFFKNLFSPIAIIVISMICVLLESKLPLKNYDNGSWIEGLLFYYFYAGTYNGFIFLRKKFFKPVKNM